ncbi:MAG: hypothetical protein EON93_04125 [Burkholderiales bacterium]|nr:MAG: hypothetical protein EON93_04125 [Burkholderiales bacterium]
MQRPPLRGWGAIRLASMVQELDATPEEQRPAKPRDRRAWERDLEDLRVMVLQCDRLIERATPQPRVGVPDVVMSESAADGAVTVCRIPKGRRAEVRVSVKPWEGRRVIDIRLWSLIDGAGPEMKPSRKGIAFDAAKLDALIDALHQAKQYV